MPLVLREHGGGCCGIRHIYSMDRGTVAELDDLLRQVRELGERQGNGRLIEIVLSARQVNGDRNPEDARWTDVLRERGFRLVSRFNNANSGNECFVFHYHPHFLSLAPDTLPFGWDHTYHPDNGGNLPGNARRGPARDERGRFTATGYSVGDYVFKRSGVRQGAIGQVTNVADNQVRVEILNAAGDVLDVAHWGNEYIRPATVAEIRSRSRRPPTAEAQEAPRAPWTQVEIATYHNVLQRGRSEAGFPTYAAARAAAPRARSVDKKVITVSQTGQVTTRWVNGVTE